MTKKEAKVWWAREDPRKSTMYVSFWVFFAWMTVTFTLSLLFSGIAPEEFRSPVPRPLWIMWVAFFSTQLILWARAQKILRARNSRPAKPEESEVPLKKINRFPGWLIVLTCWFVAWLNGLFLVLDKLVMGYEVIFPETAWYIVLGVVTSVFNISDASRERLAEDAQKSWGSLLDSFLERILWPKVIAFLEKRLPAPPEKTDVSH